MEIINYAWQHGLRRAAKKYHVKSSKNIGEWEDQDEALKKMAHMKLEHGTDEDNDPCIKLGRVVELKPVLIWKGETDGRIKREVSRLDRNMRWMVQTVTKKGKTNGASMLYIVKETLWHAIPLGEGEQCVFTADGALSTCMHPLPLPSRVPICGFTSRPQIVLCTFKHVTKNDQWGIQILFGGELCRVGGRQIDGE